ncbi:MAG: hypothetical protein ACXWXD_13385 [Candidatus Deferrimicrobiaceae bacterium]
MTKPPVGIPPGVFLWGKDMSGKTREAIVVGGLLCLLAVGILFF